MSQFLQRGFEVSDGRKIKKAVSDEGEWQIYVTNVDSFVLAVSDILYRKWVSECYLPEGIFKKCDEQGCYIFSSSANYLISSLNNGPFPDTLEQIDAFSLSYNNAVKLFKDKSLNNAIYLEEYSIILPTDFSENKSDDKIVYGRWITGGINISIDSLSRISSYMTWLRPEDIAHSARLLALTIQLLLLVHQQPKAITMKTKVILPQQARTTLGMDTTKAPEKML